MSFDMFIETDRTLKTRPQSDTDHRETEAGQPSELPLDAIGQNPDNPRELRDLDPLTTSIREIGLVNAITVASVEAYVRERPARAHELAPGARYIVVDGHRRLEAARRADLASVRVSVDDALVSTDRSLLEAAFVANVHRDDMNPLEQAYALKKLVEFYGSQNKAAKRLGIAQSTISSKLSVLELGPELQADLLAGRRKVVHVRNLSRLSPQQQKQRADARAAASESRGTDTRGAGRPVDHRHPARVHPQGAAVTGIARQRGVVTMPWADGVACAEIAIARMRPLERRRMLQRLWHEAEKEARAARQTTHRRA
ncbi:ParB/RepB/Spo0J family partition protein [Streptomyces sp. NPDC058953]|uniref:ParB/RepB/Spo0J family partition protein n=1 Tax=unclassified Streptomyces TaxID=2593676 RepID=UPI003692336A